MVLRQGMELTGAGIVLGLAGTALVTRVMATLLFGVSTTDIARGDGARGIDARGTDGSPSALHDAHDDATTRRAVRDDIRLMI